MRVLENAHLLELLNGELTHITQAKLHTWENSGIVTLLLRGVASSIIQPSYIIHKWSMHPLDNINIWELLRVFLSCFVEKNVWGHPGPPQPIFIIQISQKAWILHLKLCDRSMKAECLEQLKEVAILFSSYIKTFCFNKFIYLVIHTQAHIYLYDLVMKLNAK